MKYLVLLFLPACATVTMGQVQEDCVTRHVQVSQKTGTMTTELYDHIVDACRQIYRGRP